MSDDLSKLGGQDRARIDALATLHVHLDEPEQAEHYMRKAPEICECAGIDPDALIVLPYLA